MIAVMMLTTERLAANRANAAKSTGPRTSEGRAVAARNAPKHMLATSRHAILPHESSEEFDALLDDLRNDLQPQGAVEELLTRRVAEGAWRLQRASEYEVAALRAEGADENGAGLALWCDAQTGKGHVLELVTRYGASAERSMMAALHEIERRQARRQGQAVAAPLAVDVTISAAEHP